jgi:hypothetical protein
MAETGTPTSTPELPPPTGPARSNDEIALELMKFITVVTGYGKPSQSSAGFSAKPGGRSAEEHAEALLGLFDRCRKVVSKE